MLFNNLNYKLSKFSKIINLKKQLNKVSTYSCSNKLNLKKKIMMQIFINLFIENFFFVNAVVSTYASKEKKKDKLLLSFIVAVKIFVLINMCSKTI